MLRPLVGAGAERQRFARRRRALILQVVREERGHHVAAVMGGGVAAEIDAAQRAAGAARPAAVIPGSDDEKVLLLRVVFLEQLVDLDRPVEIFLIPPAGDVERRHRDAVQPRRKRLPFPERVVVGMADEIVPGRQRLAEVPAIGVRQRAELEIPVVGVVAIDQRRGRGHLLRGLHHVGVLEAVAQAERAVVMEVVADPHVCGRGHRHDGLERGMRIERAHHREPRRVTRADHADAAVVVGDVLEQPLDGVVGVGALVDRLRVLAIARLAQHHELALGLEAAANVLQHDDVAVGGKIDERRRDAGRRVLADAVGRPLKDDRQLVRLTRRARACRSG